MKHTRGPLSTLPDIGSAMKTVRTKRELAALFHRLGLHPTRRLGQNFLVDHNLLEALVRAGSVGPRDLVLDIGCGTGLLAGHLADAAARVIGVEVDRRLLAICSRYLEDRPNVELLGCDVLASKHTLSPTFLAAVNRALAAGGIEALRVVSNLPYSVASLIVPNLLESALPVATMVVTVQREVALRMAATPGSRDYGALSVLVQAHARATVLRAVPPSVFWPRPKVQSAMLRLVPEPERLEAVRDYRRLATVVRAAFGHRRKTLVNSMAASRRLGERPAIRAALAACGIDPGGRAEQVSREQYIELANALSAEPGPTPDGKSGRLEGWRNG